MTDSDRKMDEAKEESAPAAAETEEEERRLRERLKAKAAERQPRRDQDRVSEENDNNRRSPVAGDNRRRDDRSRSRDVDQRDSYPRRGSGPPFRRRGGPPPPRYRDQGRYRPYPPRGGDRAPRRYSNEEEEDDFGRRRPSPPQRGRPRSHSGSSRSYSSGERGRSRERSRSRRSRSRSVSSHSYSSYSSSDSSHSSSSESSASAAAGAAGDRSEDPQAALYSKDQRTVFVQQLVQRTTERDLKKYFRKQELKVNEVILLRDKRTGKHKGCAYVELRRMDDVPKAVALSNQIPSFQRFPVLVKASEAEKNYLQASAPSSTPLTASQVAKSGTLPATKNLTAKPPPLLNPTTGKLLESQKVYVGSLDPSVTQEHLFLLYSQFGYLDKVALQMDAAGISKGFAFLSFHDPKDANLAIQTMSGQVLAGRPMKTGWAVNQVPSFPGSEIVTSAEFPDNASVRTTNAYRVLAQMTMGVGLAQIRHGLVSGETSTVPAPVAASTSGVPTVADARASLAATAAVVASAAAPGALQTAVPAAAAASQNVPSDFKQVGRADNPSPHILVHNMYDKDEETEPGWETEIKEEFEEECSQYGKIGRVKVMSQEPGGKIYASFETIEGAQKCALSIAGRWFNKRQLRVQFVSQDEIPV